MKSILRNLAILLAPFMFMVFVNESVRYWKESYSSSHGVSTINPSTYDPLKCTWSCHNDTLYCKQHHVKLLRPFMGITDLPYFGFIALLQSTGNYGLANILLFVVLLPLIIWYFITRSLNIRDRIKRNKQLP